MNEIAEWGPSDHCRLMIEVKDNARVAVPKESRAARFIQPTSGVEVIYADARGEATLNAPIARTTEYWWSENQPDARSLWESKIELGEDFFNEVITNPVPLDMNILKSLTRSPLGLDLYLWLTYRTFNLKRPLRLTWPQLYRQFGADPARGWRYKHRERLSHEVSPRAEEDSAPVAGPALSDGQGRARPLAVATAPRGIAARWC